MLTVENVTAAARKVSHAPEQPAMSEIPNPEDVIDEDAVAIGRRYCIWAKTTRRHASMVNPRHRTNRRNLSDDVTGCRLLSGKNAANGQVPRARAYVSPVLDWCADRENFKEVGFGHRVLLSLVDLTETRDPVSGEASITGCRDRLLTRSELHALLALLVWQTPACVAMKLDPENDVRPIAPSILGRTGKRLSAIAYYLLRNSRKMRSPSEAVVTLMRNLPDRCDRCLDDPVLTNTGGNELGKNAALPDDIVTIYIEPQQR